MSLRPPPEARSVFRDAPVSYPAHGICRCALLLCFFCSPPGCSCFSGDGPMQKKKKSAKSWRKALTPYVWLLPSFTLMTVMVLLPILTVFYRSFQKFSKAGKIKGFIGAENFSQVLHSAKFSLVLRNTLVWTVLVVLISTILGIIIGMVLNSEFKGRKIARAIVVFPWATSLIIQASVWKFIINTDHGALNALLMKLGLTKSAVNFTSSPEAWFAWEIWVGIFVTVPFVAFCVLSGLQSIDSGYYEAAAIDGGGFWQQTFYITLPLIRPSLTVSTVLNIIYVFNSFPIIWAMTKGDPASRTDTLVTYLYKLAFINGENGQAAAVSVISFLILCVVSAAYLAISSGGGDES